MSRLPQFCTQCGNDNLKSVELLRGGCYLYDGDFAGYTDVWWDDSSTIYFVCDACDHEWGNSMTQETLRHEIKSLVKQYRKIKAMS